MKTYIIVCMLSSLTVPFVGFISARGVESSEQDHLVQQPEKANSKGSVNVESNRLTDGKSAKPTNRHIDERNQFRSTVPNSDFPRRYFGLEIDYENLDFVTSQ